jgi:DnaJ-domain-containing protein 1
MQNRGGLFSGVPKCSVVIRMPYHENDGLIINLVGSVSLTKDEWYRRGDALVRELKKSFNTTRKNQKSTVSETAGSIDIQEAYKILGLKSGTSNRDEIESAFRKLAKKYHPDKYHSLNLPQEMIRVAEAKFNQIHQAYRIIMESKH